MDYSHPLGNVKIGLIKLLSRMFSLVSLNFLKLFFRLDKNNSEVIISSAFFAPWKEDKQFQKLNLQINGTTLLDNKRLYTLHYFLCRRHNQRQVGVGHDCLGRQWDC